jgi:hypothetical protein
LLTILTFLRSLRPQLIILPLIIIQLTAEKGNVVRIRTLKLGKMINARW